MAVVGDAYVVVRALTAGFKKQVERDLSGMGSIGDRAGRDLGDGVNKGLNRNRIGSGLSANFLSEIEAARVKFRNLNIASFVLVPAIGAVVGIIGNLVSGLVVLGAVLGNVARGSIVFVAALGSLAQAAIVAKVAFRGVSDALSAGLKAQKAAADNSDAQAAAARRLRDARLSLKRLLEEEKPEALAAARERAVRAEEAAADALLGTERATRTYNQAQKNSLNALEDLNEARDDAREKIQQLRFEVEGGAISEKKARLAFEKSRDSLQRVQDLPPNSRARQEAELAFAEAELNLRKAIDNNSDLKKESEASTKAGVEGSKQVVKAKEDIAQAQQAELDSGIAAARAIRDASRATEDAAKAAADAGAGGTVERDLNRRVAAAREQVQLAQQAASKAASGGIDEYRNALEKLSPEAQSFVEFLIEQQKAFDSLRDAAGRQLFPKLEESLTIIIGKFKELEPLFEETGGILGDLAVTFAKTFFQGENFERLKAVWSTNNTLLGNLGQTVINLLEGFLVLLAAAEPLITTFGDWARNTSAAWKETKKLEETNGTLARTFEGVQTKVTLLKDTFGALKDAFGLIGEVINAPGGPGEQLLTYFKTSAESFKAFIETGEDDGSLRTFFDNSVKNFIGILDVIGKIISGFLTLGASPGVGQFITSIEKVTDSFNAIGDEIGKEDGAIAQLGIFLEEFALLTKNLTDSGAIQVFFSTLTGALKIINAVLSNEVVQSVLKFVGVLFGIITAVGRIIKVFSFLGKALLGNLALILGQKGFLALTTFFKLLPLQLKIMYLSILPGVKVFFLTKFLPFLATVAVNILKFLGGPWGLLIGVVVTSILFIVKYWDEIVAFFKETSAKIGEFFGEAWAFIKDAFFNIWQAILDYWNNTVLPFFANLGKTIGDAAKAAFDWFLNFFKDAWQGFLSFFTTTIPSWFKGLGKLISNAAGNIFAFFSDLFKDAFNGVKNYFNNTLIPFFKDLPAKIGAAAAGLWDWLKDSFKSALNFIIDKWNNFSLDIRIPTNFISKALGVAGLGFTIDTPNIPRLAAGGIVPATRGGMMAVIGEGGRSERVEPLDKDGLSTRDKAMIRLLSGGAGGGSTINVYPSAGMNERELAELVSRRLAFELRRGAV
jgi:hypothetical protein